MSTKRLIADQVLYRLYGGNPDSSAPVQLPDVYKALEQKINAQYALQQYSLNLPSGSTIPNNIALATYDNVIISPMAGNQSYATLPVTPISLPRNAGINEIRPNISSTGNINLLGDPFIPLQAGQGYLLQADKLLNGLFGGVAYEINGKKAIFSKNLIPLGVTKCQMKLVVFDMSQYGETDDLPIPASDEEILVNDLVKQFSDVVSETGIVNPYTTSGQQPNK